MSFGAMLSMLVSALVSCLGGGQANLPTGYEYANVEIQDIAGTMRDYGVTDIQSLDGVDVQGLYDALKEETSDLFTVVDADEDSIKLQLQGGQEVEVEWSSIPFIDKDMTEQLIKEAQKLMK